MKRILVVVQRVELYKKEIKSKIKFHITVGNQTVMGTVICFFSQRMEDEIDESIKQE